MKRNVALIALSALVAGLLLPVSAPAAHAAVMTTLSVSPTGSGTACSPTNPCSLTTARSTARSLAPTMTGDIVVQLAGGTYTLSSTFSLTNADSGRNGHRMIYQAAPGTTPVISGGTTIASNAWTLHDSTLNIWKASIPRDLLARQIYVDGTVARLARQSAAVLGTVTQQPASATSDYTITNSAIATWPRATDIEFGWVTGGMNVTTHNSWLDAACRVSAITATTVTMRSGCYTIATALIGTEGNAVSANVNRPTYIENNYNLLGNPNQFYIDPTATSTSGTLYYVPASGTMSGKTVVIPTVQTLVEAGTSAETIENLTISGLTFQHATWLPTDEDGVTPWQANNLVTGDPAHPDVAMVPSAVAFHKAANVVFSGNTITRVGGSGVSFDGGGSNNSIVGNRIFDVAGNGINVGTGPWYTDPAVLETNTTIANNYVHTVATHYIGGVGIFAGVVAQTSIVHNEVWNVPYTGISLGWGWNSQSTPYPAADNEISYNYVHDTMTSALYDGGGIYVIGPHASSPRSTMTGNWVDQSNSHSNFFYLDGGSTNWDVTNNVITRVPAHTGPGLWLWINYFGQQSGSNNTVSNNYTNDTLANDPGTTVNNTFTNNQTGLTTLPAAAVAIQQQAGLEPQYLSLRGGAPTTNLAFGAATTTSSTYGTGWEGSQAVNGDVWSGWSPSGSDTAAYWQVDLGASYPLSALSLQTRFSSDTSLDQPSTRQNFTVQASNSSNMANAVTLCSQGSSVLPYKSKFDCAVSGTYRYVRISKTDTGYFFLTEVMIYGKKNLALSGTATASSTYGSNWVASRAIDGDNNTGWSPTGSDPAANLQVDLGSSKPVTTVQLVTRQELDQSETRRNFVIRVSNSAGTSGATVACTQGATSLPFQAVYTCDLPTGNWRYISAGKTDGGYFYITELGIY